MNINMTIKRRKPKWTYAMHALSLKNAVYHINL